LRAVATNFQSRDNNVESAIALNLPFESIEKIALKLGNLPATKTCHVNVIALRSSLIIMFLALQVHEIEFIHKAVTL
jgi:hypothetical protein